MNRDQIKSLALSHGFKLKEQPCGAMDLNPYVYEFAQALLLEAKQETSQRKYAAINIMAALAPQIGSHHKVDWTAKCSVQMADALMAELEKTNG